MVSDNFVPGVGPSNNSTDLLHYSGALDEVGNFGGRGLIEGRALVALPLPIQPGVVNGLTNKRENDGEDGRSLLGCVRSRNLEPNVDGYGHCVT